MFRSRRRRFVEPEWWMLWPLAVILLSGALLVEHAKRSGMEAVVDSYEAAGCQEAKP